MAGNLLLAEEIEPGLKVHHTIKKLFGSTQTKWQQVDFVELEAFGKSLVIDGLMQSCEVDEFVYHECLVHPALLLHPNPKRVYIGGGGEGSTAREVLKHKSVEKCVMVDIDGEVVRFCKENLEANTTTFANPRLELHIEDAKKILEETPEKFDVIIMDLDDPLEGGPCYQLYTKEFYSMVMSKLNVGGIFVTQSGQAGIKQHTAVWAPIHSTLKAVFPKVIAYNQAVYSFLDEWGFNIAFTDESRDVAATAKTVDSLIEERIGAEDNLQFLDGVSWQGIWATSKRHRETLAKETTVMSTSGTHRFMHNPGVATLANRDS
jgi:thermospermine synthase|eukprot:TRINITY_DN78143_c0_g1_i1.p1 TRINITY_DN78143_c0_g1~~TRINITY_DN78143_c0_g1_i1.p1  ORF type:complete len:319 (-),score=54.82 TRINITY_DN78143_c0_g1_i1:80-1036(-)